MSGSSARRKRKGCPTSTAEHPSIPLAGNASVIVDRTSAWSKANVESGCDRALAAGRVVLLTSPMVALIPDLIVAEGHANGLEELPRSPHLRRRDGRVVHLFRWPATSPLPGGEL